jgi:hypothetical protein
METTADARAEEAVADAAVDKEDKKEEKQGGGEDEAEVQETPTDVVEAEDDEEDEEDDDSPNRQILAHKTAIVKVFATTQAWDHDCPWQALRSVRNRSLIHFFILVIYIFNLVI